MEDEDDLTGLYLLAERMPSSSTPPATTKLSASALPPVVPASPAAAGVLPATTLDAQTAPNHWGSREVSAGAYKPYFLRLDYSKVLVDAEKGAYNIDDILVRERAAKASARYWKEAVLHATAVQKKADVEIAKQRAQLAEERSTIVEEDDETGERTS